MPDYKNVYSFIALLRRAKYHLLGNIAQILRSCNPKIEAFFCRSFCVRPRRNISIKEYTFLETLGLA